MIWITEGCGCGLDVRATTRYLRGECMYQFKKPLIKGKLLKRKSQFTALVDIDGEELIAHIPTTNRIGDVENKNLPCLLSYHDDPTDFCEKWFVCRII